MAQWTIVALALIGCAVAEPPVGYSYSAPGLSHGSSGSVLSSGGHYSSVPVGHQTSEGYHIDPHLLEKIRHVILKDEIHNQAYQSSASGHGISSHYGAPVYGVPHDRIVGVELESLQQGIQVAQYHQAVEDHSGYSNGYSGGYTGGYSGGYSGGSSGGYSSGYSSGYPSGYSSGHGYSTINAPSGSYGIPSPSSSYGVPH
ncbi:prisilkin-39 [Pieris rapae]|uniref:prisilkin-39 n=1 Tax=Pieris rapae TaxID=64459 RepID=UPI001E27F845|nr:prisilkin-39 [Pieris rapae]